MASPSSNEDFLDYQWTFIEEHYKKGQPLTANVIEVNEKGLVVDVGGIRGVVLEYFYFSSIEFQEQANPVEKSQHILESSAYLKGQNLQLKVVEVDRTCNHLALTQNLLTKEERKKLHERQKQIVQELLPGDVRQGIVTSVTKLAVWVAVEGVEGWVSRGQLSWNDVLQPQELVRVGELVDVIVLKANGLTLELSVKCAHQSDEILRSIQPEDTRRGRVFALADFGVFVELDGVYGLVPTSELRMPRYIKHPSDFLALGQELDVKVTNVVLEEKRIMLSVVNFNNE